MDPTTSPRTLACLAGDSELAALVASNPNAPVDLLLTLAADHPRAFLDNPALPFLLLEHPDLPQGLSRAAAAAVLRFEDAPPVILKQLRASDDQVIAELSATHVGLEGEFVGADGMGMSATPNHEATLALEIQQAFNRFILLTADGQKDWLRLPNLYPRWFLELLATVSSFRAAVAQCPDAPGALRDCPADASPMPLANAAITSPTLSLEAFTRLAHDPHFEVRVALARRNDTPASVRQTLSTDSDVRIRHAVAIHPQTPPELLAAMATDESYRVRYGVALNTNTPQHALQRLAGDHDHQVRAMVARNPSTDEATLEALLNDDNHVRVSLARNPACPERLLVRLLSDANDEARCAALRRINPTAQGVNLEAALADERLRVVAANPRLPAPLLTQITRRLDPALPNRYDGRLARALTGNPATPPGTLDRLAHIPDAETQALVARHAHSAPATLAWLCEHVRENAPMSLNLARNPATPDGALEYLAETSDYAVAQTLIARLGLPPNERQQVYRRLLRYNLRAQRPAFATGRYDASGRLAPPETNRLLRLVALASPLLSEEDYRRGVASPLWSERYILARNPAAPRIVARALIHDGHRYVRAAARQNLAARQTTKVTDAPPAIPERPRPTGPTASFSEERA